MADEEEVNIRFEVEDEATPKMSRMEKAAEKLDHAVGRASERFSRFSETAGAIAGVVGGAEALRSAKEYIDHVDRINNLTDIAADHVAGMSEALQIAGVESGEVEGLLTRMVKKSALLTEENKAQAKLAERYGVNLTQGPQKSLIAIAKLVEDNKIGAGQVGRILGVQGSTLANLMDAMNKGPAALDQMFKDAIEKNAFLGGATMDVMQDFDESINRVHLAWKRMFAGVIVRIAPAVTKIVTALEGSIESIADKAGRFAHALVSHMQTIVSLARTYAKLMLANTVISKFTGKGIVGTAMMLGSNTDKGFFGGAGSSGIAKTLKEFFTGAVQLRPLLMVFARFALIAGAVAVIYYLFKKIMTATEGAGLRIRQIFENIWTNLQAIGRQFMTMFSEDSTLGRFFRWLGEEGLLGIIEKIASLLNEATAGLRLLTIMLTEHVGPTKARTILRDQVYEETGLKKMLNAGVMVDLFKGLNGKGAPSRQLVDQFNAFDRARSAYEAVGGPSIWSDANLKALRARYTAAPAKSNSKPESAVYQDFRGSRFDVTQQFAEGFDPDRIAVGFANDLAAIGERRLQSGFSPLFTVR